MRDPNLDQLIAAAAALRPLLPELVFVGGCVTGLLITDKAAGEPRGTIDVDAIAEITLYSQYAKFGDRLRSLGFREDTSERAPLCRWVQGGMILDVMPLDENILGFSKLIATDEQDARSRAQRASDDCRGQCRVAVGQLQQEGDRIKQDYKMSLDQLNKEIERTAKQVRDVAWRQDQVARRYSAYRFLSFREYLLRLTRKS